MNLLKNAIKYALKIFRSVFRKLFSKKYKKEIFIYFINNNPAAIIEKFSFFFPGVELKKTDCLRFGLFFSAASIIHNRKNNILLRLRPRSYFLDKELNHHEGWEWIRFFNEYHDIIPNIAESYANFKAFIDSIKLRGHDHVFVFGTGTSLRDAIKRRWSDGIRIVCNTIVRDPKLWSHINPHVIVAGDGIYHFGASEYAKAFRGDLKLRLQDSPETVFIYPAFFDGIVRRELSGLRNRLIPIPSGTIKGFNYSLLSQYKLPNLGNVLSLLLLPIAIAVSRHIYLWGFDGRAPSDKGFWSNSASHSYPEHMESLRRDYPAFFEHFVPSSNPMAYVNAVHGDQLRLNLEEMEGLGYQIMILHDSYTEALMERRIELDNFTQ
jgi:hypothetical protein